MKILGREPALILGVIVAVISLLGTLGFTFLSDDQAGLWIAAVNAVAAAVIGWTTRPLSPGIYTFAVGALIALATGYGFEFTAEQVNGVNGLVVPILILVTRNQISPVTTPVTQPSQDPTIEAAKKEGIPTDTKGPVETTA